MLSKLMTLLQKRTTFMEKGQDLAEYATFLGLIALVVVVALTIIGNSIANVFYYLADAIHSWTF